MQDGDNGIQEQGISILNESTTLLGESPLDKRKLNQGKYFKEKVQKSLRKLAELYIRNYNY